MKNAINYYYNLILGDIHQNDKFYYFDYDNARYILIAYNGDVNVLNDIYNLHLNLHQNGIYVHQIVLNRDNQIITLINGIPYVLMKAKYYEGKVNYGMVVSFLNTPVDKILNFNNRESFVNKISKRNNNSLLERINWGALWAEKNDYLEYQISQLGQRYQNIRDSFSYYIGLGETGIQLVNSLPIDTQIKVIAHRRINSEDTVFDLYNPLNLIMDSRVRDVSEYFKTSFFNGKNIDKELDHFLKFANLNESEYMLFLARMLYPTYYFDLFEDIISGKKDDKEMKKITNLASDYEILLKRIYRYYKSMFNLQPIEWLDTY